MLTIEIMGGLGNQLFQIFTLLSTALDNKIAFYFEYKEQPARKDRPFYWDNFLNRLSVFIKPMRPELMYKERDFHYIPIPCNKFPTDKNLKLFGYFQSYKYFHHNKDTIFRLINLEDHQNDIKNKYENNFFENTVSLHFRMGDYKNLQHHHPIMSIEYYINCISELINITGKDNWKILYFYEKNDETIVTNNVTQLNSKFPNITFVSVDHALADWEQMLSMSLCKHNIIANSTFSWWGAYLNSNENKVFYPSEWFGPAQGNKKVEDLFMVNWIKIKTPINIRK